jgi:hypothetical protein
VAAKPRYALPPPTGIAPRPISRLSPEGPQPRTGEGNRAQVDDAAGRIPVERRRVRAHDLGLLDQREIHEIERRAPVGLRLGNAVDQDAHAARRAGVGAVARAAGAKAADREPHVAPAGARLREHPRDERQRFVEPHAAPPVQLLTAHDRDGQRDVEDGRWRARRRDAERRQWARAHCVLRGERRTWGEREGQRTE